MDHSPEVRSCLPAGFDLEATARSRGAFRRARGVKDAETLCGWRWRMACGMSLRETCAWAAAAGLASLWVPPLIERLAKAAPLLGDVVGELIAEQAKVPAGRRAGRRLRALDGTSICQPGADRTMAPACGLRPGDQSDRSDRTDRWARSGDLAPPHLPSGRCRAGRSLLCQTARPAAGDRRRRRLHCAHRLELVAPFAAGRRSFDLFAALAAQAEQEGEIRVRVDEGRKDDRRRRR